MARKLEIEVTNDAPIVVTPEHYLVTIAGDGAILFNRMPTPDELDKISKKNQAKEDPMERERANWKSKLYLECDQVSIPGENIHECLVEGAQYFGRKIPGEGNKTYTDVVKSATVAESILFGFGPEDDRVVDFGKMCNGNPSKGKKNGCKVYKIRPMVRPWGGTFKLHVFDARLTPRVLETIITYAGVYRGLCDWRPTFGRFTLVKIEKS